MSPLVLTLRKVPDQRLDLSPLVPHRLAGKSRDEIARIELQTTREKVTVAEAFHVRMGDPASIRIEGACERLDRIGHEMAGGKIEVFGDAGVETGRLMSGGRLSISGSTGQWTASGMRGGLIEIGGTAGDRLGGPLAGEVAGMRGGLVVVRGSAGSRIGDRMRRGMIIVEGRSGPWAGSGMIAGTILLCRAAGASPGYLMRRGTIVLGEGCEAFSPTFIDCGIHSLVAMRLMAGFVAPHSARAARIVARRLRRLGGDMAVLGKGEIFTAEWP